MKTLSLLALSIFISFASGCAMCSNCGDAAPNAYGGVADTMNQGYGRVGSALTSSETVTTEELNDYYPESKDSVLRQAPMGPPQVPDDLDAPPAPREVPQVKNSVPEASILRPRAYTR